MIDEGCRKVEGGDPRGGVKILMRAFDLKPGDLDVLVCLAQGYTKLGNLQSASAFYKRALDRSPRHRSALRGAAKTAAKLGQTSQAVKLYQRVLDMDPGNKEAKDYLAAHGGQPKAPSGGQPAPDKAPVRGGAPEPIEPPAKPPSG
jgi:Flp pilus assembly protein TadD